MHLIDVLKLIEIIGGDDRCNGSVLLNSLEFENNKFNYSTYITSNKLLNWSNKTQNGSDCRNCCIGFLNYSFHTSNNSKQFNNIRLVEEYLIEEKNT